MKQTFFVLFALASAVSPGYSATTISLDGHWKFAVDSSGVFTIDSVSTSAYWRDALVPLSWQEQFSDLRSYQGVAWYEKEFDLPKLKKDEAAILHFGAVDYLAKVFVNGKPAGEHEGGYLPFDIDITKLIDAGTNNVVVRVMDPSTSKDGTEGIIYSQIPHGKQSWYVQTSGLWQSVFVDVKPALYFEEVHVTPSVDGGVSVDGMLSALPQTAREEKCAISIFDPSQKEVARFVKPIASGTDSFRFSFELKSPLLWGVDSPNLYTIRLVLVDGDTAVERFGFRSFTTNDGKFYLNGKPIYLMGALDQDFYPETGYTPPSFEYIRDEMLKAKMLGLNLLRCHIKVPDPRYLQAADEVGMLVWYEIPNWDDFTSASAKRGIETFDGMLDRDWNHPSVVIISIINESWGIDLRDSTEREWLRNTYDYAKSKATGRLIEDNSACCDNFHMKSDIADWHTYWAIPENRKNFNNTVIDVASRPNWLFSRHGDARPSGQEPLMISEFGNWGLPKIPDDLPWWLRRPFGWGYVEPEGVRERFHEYKLDQTFQDYDSLAVESQWAQFDALKYEIEEIRLQSSIQGYVITEFTDINWECNGLMDMWRNPKIYSKEIGDIQKQDVIISRPDKYNFKSRETMTVRLWVSHYSAQSLAGGMLEWQAGTDGRGSIPVPDIANSGVTELAPLVLRLPEVVSPLKIELSFQLKNSSRAVVARNSAGIFVYPDAGISNLKARIYDPDSSLGKLEREIPPADSDVSGRVMITSVLDSIVVGDLEEGASVVCLVDDSTRIPPFFPFRLGVRDTGGYDGNWASNMNWVRAENGPFAGLSFARHLGFESADVPPRIIIAGLSSQEFGDVFAGMYIGWIHLNAAYVLQMRVGKGKLILCTLPIAGAFERDPYSRSLFARMVNYVSSPSCAPELSVLNK
ncbi:MAG TPA: sugar-binding domain-containing protein [Candidatus Kryptonia bacterium]